jgi:hypothetical protein
MTRNRYTDDEHDAIVRYVRDNHRAVDRVDPHAWRRSAAFLALCAGIPGHSDKSVGMKTITAIDTLQVGTSPRVWTHDNTWVEASLERIGTDAPPETAADVVRRLGGGELLFGEDDE